MEVPQEPGLGSRHQKQQREELLQPCSTVPGVSLPVKDFWAGVDVEWDEPLLDELFYKIPLDGTQVNTTVDDLLDALRALLVQSTVEFKTVRTTIECWKDSMLDVASQSGRARAGLIRAFFLSLGQLDIVKWLVPTYRGATKTKPRPWRSLLDEDLANHNGWPKQHLAAEWFKTMFVLHFFSGRKRPNDLQSYLEAVTYPSGVRVEILSADIIFGEGGDFSQRGVQQRWLEWMTAGYVLAFFAGPPCETFSVARYHEVEHYRVRPIRSRESPWGFSSLTLREARQILIGNLLILFVLRAAIIQCAIGHFACIEHPEEPLGANRDQAASIWRLTLMQHIYRMPKVVRCSILQGRFGAPSPKPTSLLFIGPTQPRASLRKCESLVCSKGTSIGLERDGGAFQTAKLKEYPGDLCCKALSITLSDWLAEHDGIIAHEQPSNAALAHLAVFRQQLDDQAEQMGPDYNCTAKAI